MPVLLIAYLNYQGVKNRIVDLSALGFTDIYVFLDGYTQTADKIEANIRLELITYLRQCKSESIISSLNESHENLGVGIAIPVALDWFFSNFEMGLILEDDCRLIELTREKVNGFENILSTEPNSIICLSTPKLITSEKQNSGDADLLETSFFSSWGWICTRATWQENRVRSISVLEVAYAVFRTKYISAWRKILLFLSWTDIWRKLRKNQNKLWAFRFTVLVILSQTRILYPKFKCVQHEPSWSGTNVRVQPDWDHPLEKFSEQKKVGYNFIINQSFELSEYQAVHTQGASVNSLIKRSIFAMATMLNIK